MWSVSWACSEAWRSGTATGRSTYGDDITYDGRSGDGHGPVPYQPDNVVTPYHLIAARNSGAKPRIPDQPDFPPHALPVDVCDPSTPPDSQPPTQETPPPATPTTPSTSTTPPTTPDVPPPLAEIGNSAPVTRMAGGAVTVVTVGAGALHHPPHTPLMTTAAGNAITP
ncbi:hypothetical protein [Streptomyces mirabilis]|uniref:hypothetical protein n=1 Tax=Streptomyces mirabilis TaxID=68239 RepID=UPI00368E08C6